jgi:hypothetical protein
VEVDLMLLPEIQEQLILEVVVELEVPEVLLVFKWVEMVEAE